MHHTTDRQIQDIHEMCSLLLAQDLADNDQDKVPTAIAIEERCAALTHQLSSNGELDVQRLQQTFARLSIETRNFLKGAMHRAIHILDAHNGHITRPSNFLPAQKYLMRIRILTSAPSEIPVLRNDPFCTVRHLILPYHDQSRASTQWLREGGWLHLLRVEQHIHGRVDLINSLQQGSCWAWAGQQEDDLQETAQRALLYSCKQSADQGTRPGIHALREKLRDHGTPESHQKQLLKIMMQELHGSGRMRSGGTS